MGRFWSQDSGAYRTFQLVYTVLTLNFLVPAVSYLVAPQVAVDQVHQISALLGAAPYPAAEDGHMWRFLAFANVMALGFMCLLLQINLRRWYPVLLPLMFLKSCAVFGSAYIGLVQVHHRFFAFPVVFDGLTVVAMGVFASRARRQIALLDDRALVPRPRCAMWEGAPRTWTALERRWLRQIAVAMVPGGGGGIEAAGLEEALERLRRGMPPLQRLALRAGVWMVALGAGPRVGRWRGFGALDAGQRDRALAALGTSDRFLVRELVVLLKLAAALAWETDPAFRRGLGWGEGRPVRIEGVGA